ncbi:FecR family protein [Maribacter sp.]|uniref:FecR family protein n=1 Tax=Maribacter sp. TaxID=1897614 RepID=UPI00329867AC
MEKINPKNINFSSMTEEETSVLKKRIFNTIHQKNTRKRNYWYTALAAACFIGCIGLSFYYYNNAKVESSITDFVNSSNTNDSDLKSGEVVLTLGEGNSLKIKEDVASVNYSNTGENVTIGSNEVVNQKTTKNKKAVFNTLTVPYGKRSDLTLSDGTKVWLNSGSKLVYPIAFADDKREVYIVGEAIFEVTHNKKKPFYVVSDYQVVEVLGTVFGVTNYPDEKTTNTVLKSGSVQINFKDINHTSSHSDKMKITPGTKASFNKKSKSIVSEKVNVDNYFSWKEGVLIFKNNDLQFIMKRISRYYNIEITIENENLATETFSGYLDLNEDILSVINSIKESTNMEYIQTENQILIK